MRKLLVAFPDHPERDGLQECACSRYTRIIIIIILLLLYLCTYARAALAGVPTYVGRSTPNRSPWRSCVSWPWKCPVRKRRSENADAELRTAGNRRFIPTSRIAELRVSSAMEFFGGGGTLGCRVFVFSFPPYAPPLHAGECAADDTRRS